LGSHVAAPGFSLPRFACRTILRRDVKKTLELEENMRAIVLGRAATVLSWGVLTAVLYGADCLAAETGKRIGREEMIVEPGDPEARYDRNRRDWFVRPKTLAKPEDGTPASQMEISLLDSSPVLPVNGPGIEALGPWASPAMDSIEKVLDSAGLDQPVIMVITLRPKAKPEFAVVASEKLGAEARQKIVQMLEQPAPPRPFFVDCHFAFVYHPRKMKASNDPGIPASLYPSWQESRQYQGAATAEKVRLLRKWCREQVVPLLAGAATQADSQFEGVRAFGDRILHLDPNQPFDVEKLTFHDPNFWRATLEMARGNSTIAGCQIALFAANGELAKASRLLQFCPHPAEPGNLADLLLARLSRRIDDIEAATGKRIQEGIRLFEQKQYEKAASLLEEILKENPASAWATHELLLTRMTMTHSEEAAKDYDSRVYGLDPLYPMAPIHVDSGERLYRGLLRMSTRELFKNKTRWKEDFKKYAEIVFDLDEYGYAGLLYWNVFTSVDPGNDESLSRLLYCLEKLGAPQIKENFKPEYSAGFDRIEQDRRKRMEEHPAYNAMQKRQ
jgi:tetratricopeptide (TPR) repeat protein